MTFDSKFLHTEYDIPVNPNVCTDPAGVLMQSGGYQIKFLGKSNQIKLNQIKLNQIKSNQGK